MFSPIPLFVYSIQADDADDADEAIVALDAVDALDDDSILRRLQRDLLTYNSMKSPVGKY